MTSTTLERERNKTANPPLTRVRSERIRLELDSARRPVAPQRVHWRERWRARWAR